jgi:ribonucleoside-diphosphate reductase beta chain
MSKLFEERIPYKPFEYPVYYEEGWLKQAQAFWLHTEISMQGDVKDWNEVLTKEEKNLVGNILLGFAQTECAVSDYWTTMVTNWFPKHEIKQMAMMFGSQETIHATAYSYLNETLGLDDFSAFLHEPAVAEKFELLTQTTADWTHKDLATNPQARKEVARSLAIFSAFSEGVSLYSSFAVLYSFQMRNMLKGIGQQMKWSVRDESLHSKMGCQLFRHMCDEFPELLEDSKESILEAANLIVELESRLIWKT